LQHSESNFINATEISAQEAAYNILGLHLSEASEGNVFINTCHPDKRVRRVRSNRSQTQQIFLSEIYLIDTCKDMNN